MTLEFDFVPWVYTALVGVTLASAFALCGGKVRPMIALTFSTHLVQKKKHDRGTSESASKDKTGSKDRGSKDKAGNPKIRAPEKKHEMAGKFSGPPPTDAFTLGTYDPNYQTLANVNQNVFGPDPKAPKPPPKPQGYAGTYDANYQVRHLCIDICEVT